MEQITLEAMAKINLGLDVLGRREDGYHEVRMIMQTLALHDTLSFQLTGGEVSMTCDRDGLPVDGRNLVLRAIGLMREKYGIAEGIRVHLVKRIPVAAGMAGGSTDAAAAFVAANQLFSLGLTGEELRGLAVGVGADVPYCLLGGTALSEGIGERLTVLPAAPDYTVVVARPPIEVSTAEVYRGLRLQPGMALSLPVHPDIDGMAEAIRRGDREGMTASLSNVLETVTAARYPAIGRIKELLLARGAAGALMSGSGPCVFALYDRAETAEDTAGALRAAGMAREVIVTHFSGTTCIPVSD